MIVKKHISEGRLILAICDEDLLGKEFSKGDRILNLKSDFYKGNKLSEDELKEIIKKSYVINAVGKKTIDFLISEKFINSFLKIKDVPYAQVVVEQT